MVTVVLVVGFRFLFWFEVAVNVITYAFLSYETASDDRLRFRSAKGTIQSNPDKHMNQDIDSHCVPRAPRFKVADASDVTVTITRTEESDPQPLAVELLDVSQYGVKLRVPIHLRFEESLQLKIEVTDSNLDYLGVASVRHIRNVDKDHWVVGCAIAPAFSDEAFSYLATTAGKERRRFRRLPISAEATVRRQAQTEGVEATLHNLSSGGFCFSSAEHFAVGEMVQITVVDTGGNPRVVDARICWQVDNDDGSIAGCKFSSRSSYAELCACLTEQPALKAPSQYGESPTSKLVLTVAVLVMFIPPMITLMMQANKVSAEAREVPQVTESKAEKGQDKKGQDRNVASSKIREWVDNTGKHRTLAELVEVTADHIVLQKPNGRQAKVPLHRLSEADHDYVQEWHARIGD